MRDATGADDDAYCYLPHKTDVYNCENSYVRRIENISIGIRKKLCFVNIFRVKVTDIRKIQKWGPKSKHFVVIH